MIQPSTRCRDIQFSVRVRYYNGVVWACSRVFPSFSAHLSSLLRPTPISIIPFHQTHQPPATRACPAQCDTRVRAVLVSDPHSNSAASHAGGSARLYYGVRPLQGRGGEIDWALFVTSASEDRAGGGTMRGRYSVPLFIFGTWKKGRCLAETGASAVRMWNYLIAFVIPYRWRTRTLLKPVVNDKHPPDLADPADESFTTTNVLQSGPTAVIMRFLAVLASNQQLK
ncbi:hypothetical protein B0H11DRAFT_1142506 [Mycena galericulata]|nr:hypothetical protein B0H11DRAFT_1142506 [Mycena galericulata]